MANKVVCVCDNINDGDRPQIVIYDRSRENSLYPMKQGKYFLQMLGSKLFAGIVCGRSTFWQTC